MLQIKPPSILLAFAFCGLLAASAYAQKLSNFGKCPVEYGFQGSFNFGKESKSLVTIRKLKEISPLVLNKIQRQLKARVGEQFFKRLKLDYGDAQDFDDTSPLKADDAERIDGYDFVFKFSDKSKGLKAYYFKVVADAKGNLIADVALPNIASNPEKARLIPCQQALAIASRNGFPLERSSILFIYDWDSKTLVWHIYDKRPVEPDNPIPGFSGNGTYRNIFVDANNGNVIKIFKETIAL